MHSSRNHDIADIVGGLHRDGGWNEAHEVVLVSQDHDSSDGTETKQFLIT